MHFSLLGLRFRSLIWIILLLFPALTRSQDCVPTNLNGKVYNISCGPACIDLQFQVPHMRATSDYEVLTVPYTPYPYLDASAQESAAIYDDDVFGDVVPLPFPFCFYDSAFNNVTVGSNGLITFDISNANCSNAYTIDPKIPYSLGRQCDAVETYYPRASIMGAYSDLDPRIPASLRDRKVEWFTIGAAPCRKFIISYYHIGTWSATGACDPYWNTFQIVLHESTGIIEIFLEQKSLCAMSSNMGKAIIGIQNWNQDKGLSAPARNATQWKENNIGYRFVPSSGASRFAGSELYNLAGDLIAVADTGSTKPGLLDLHYPNICPPPDSSTTYILKTAFAVCSGPLSLLESYDTIYVKRRLNVTMTETASACAGGKNGAIKVSIAPGVGQPPYTFLLDGTNSLTGNDIVTFNNVAEGIHTVRVTDAAGCSSGNLKITVLAGPPIITTVTKSDASCYGSNSGTITVRQPISGVAPFEYSINGSTWQTQNIFSGLAADTYVVYYREAGGCQGAQFVTITEPPALSIIANGTDALCNGANSGSILVKANGGTAPYQYSIDGTNWQDANSFAVSAGNYTATIRDANNCTINQPVIINQPSGVSLSTLTANGTCGGGKDGKITVSATGGIGPYQYSINGVAFQPSNIFNVDAGTYRVTVKDNSGCSFSMDAIVGLTNDLAIEPQKDTSVCEGGFLQLQVNSPANTYLWTPATGLSNSGINNPNANPTITTEYIVNASWGPCTASDTVIISVKPAPIPDAGEDGYICFGQSYNLQGSGGVQFHWSPSTALNDPAISHPVSSAEHTTNYSLSVVDANGCSSLINDEVVVDVTPPIRVINTPSDTIGYMGDQFQLLASSEGNMYSWSPSAGLDDPTIPNPTVTLGTIGTDIIYKVIASTRAGCKGEGEVRIRVYAGPEIYVPTGFTPNSDGKNDRFIPIPIGISKLNYFRVFNRAGQMIFSTVTFMDGWDGRFAGKEQPSGVYVWMIQALTKDNRVISRKGTVALIR